MEYSPEERLIVPMFSPVRALRSCTWAPSTPCPDSSVMVPVRAPVVTPWARTGDGATTTSARAATAPTSVRRLNMNALLGGKGEATKLGRQPPVQQGKTRNRLVTPSG